MNTMPWLKKAWKLVLLPSGQEAKTCKWIFKVKLKVDDSFDKYKSRVVVKGFLQNFGIDYVKTVSSVIKFTTIQVILIIYILKIWMLKKIDINNAFLNEKLE